MNKSAVIARLATQDEAIQRGSCRMDCFALPAMTEDDEQTRCHCEGLQRKTKQSSAVLAEWIASLNRQEQGTMNNPAIIARLATQDEAIQRSSCRMDCFALPAMTEDDEQICGHCEACNARRSNPARFLQNVLSLFLKIRLKEE